MNKKRADRKKSLSDYDRQNTVTKSLQAYFFEIIIILIIRILGEIGS